MYFTISLFQKYYKKERLASIKIKTLIIFTFNIKPIVIFHKSLS